VDAPVGGLLHKELRDPNADPMSVPSLVLSCNWI
jgi:uncharacterized protein YceH (UPF0502 family)